MATPSFEIIGRDPEREIIESLLDRPRPSVLVLDGEAGIGKTTLWSFARRASAARGDRVFAWRASQAERELAFGALMGLLEADLDDLLDRIPRARGRALARALGRLEDGGQIPEPGLVGFAVLDVLRAVSADGSVTVALDDTQWCDTASASAIGFAARRLKTEPVAFAFAVRTGEPDALAPEVLAAIPEDRRERISVGPLSIGALGRLIRERTGVVHPRPLLVRIHDASRGNPFVALEMSRSLVRHGAEPAAGEPFPVSPEVGSLVRDRLGVLSPSARRVLLVVSMTSQPTVGLVRRVLGPDAESAVDEVIRQEVVVAEGERLRVAHPMYASIAYADAPPGERGRERRALAEATDDPLERAIHRAATVDTPDPAVAGELEAAALMSVQRGAPGVAADLFERAAGMRGGAAATSLRMEASSARLSAGDATGAASLLRTALADEAEGPPRARVLLALGEVVYLENPADALALLLEALGHAQGDPELTATVQITISVLSDADPEAGQASAAAAVELLESGVVDNETLLAAALLERAFHWLLRGERLATEDIDRATAMLDGAGDSFITRSAQERAERILYHAGRLREALAFDEMEYRRLVDRGQLGLLPPIVQSMSVLEQLVGDWPAARAHARECLDLVEQGEEVWRERAEMARGRILAWDGDLDAAREIGLAGLAREEADGDAWEATIFCALLGFVELSVPDPPVALEYLVRANAYADQLRVRLPTVFRYLGDLVEAAVLAGDLELAEATLVERLEAPTERIPLPWVIAVSARGRGHLAAARGEPDDAVAWFDRSLAALDEAPMPFERARSVLGRGQALLRAGHRRLARTDLEEARTVFADLGAMAWTNRAEAELARLGGRAASRWELTPSERSVAELAAMGHSNREIADRLVLSVRTVESHLASAYRKLDIRSRVQLASALPGATDEAAPIS
ncbi:MAG TPA: LuxR C-terminal-related transcriptional regulator [Candidatus Limnocylindria bacterium]